MKTIEQPTEKQLKLIDWMERVTGLQFTGNTKQEASQWIDEHQEEFEDARWADDHGSYSSRRGGRDE